MSFDELMAEHQAARANALEQRREFRRGPEAKFSRVMESAMREFSQARQTGVAFDVAVKGLEECLRAAWPRKTSKFTAACETCQDTGREIMTCCHQMRCGRRSCEDSHPAHEHTWARPCGCQAGDKFRRRASAPEDEIARVGRTQRPRNKGFTRFGQ